MNKQSSNWISLVISQLKKTFVNKFLQIILILLQIKMTVVRNILCLLVFTLNVSDILTRIFSSDIRPNEVRD